MTTFKKVNRFADRGADAEKAVQKFLTDWGLNTNTRDWARLVDSKAAGRVIKAAAADFEVYRMDSGTAFDEGPRYACLIEVKETQHDYRIDYDRITQMARLRKRANAGVICMVVVLHSGTGLWRCLPIEWMLANKVDKGSWDLRKVPTFPTVEGALHSSYPEFF